LGSGTSGMREWLRAVAVAVVAAGCAGASAPATLASEESARATADEGPSEPEPAGGAETAAAGARTESDGLLAPESEEARPPSDVPASEAEPAQELAGGPAPSDAPVAEAEQARDRDHATAELPCCGDAGCVQSCESPADCPRCRPLCSRGACAAVGPLEGRAECRRDADCILVDDGELPCQACRSCSAGVPTAWSRRGWQSEVRRARRQCGRRSQARCGPCPERRHRYVPTEAICVEGRCVAHGGALREASPLDGL
jgi:hypothetical protein